MAINRKINKDVELTYYRGKRKANSAWRLGDKGISSFPSTQIFKMTLPLPHPTSFEILIYNTFAAVNAYLDSSQLLKTLASNLLSFFGL